MQNMTRWPVFVMLMLGFTPVFGGDSTLNPAQEPAERLVRQLFVAFNQADPKAMGAMVSDNVIWMGLSGVAVVIEAEGREALIKAMESYFKSIPSARSQIEAIMVAGSRVAVRERTYWKTADGEQSQMALAVYEVVGNKINSAFYFPIDR